MGQLLCGISFTQHLLEKEIVFVLPCVHIYHRWCDSEEWSLLVLKTNIKHSLLVYIRNRHLHLAHFSCQNCHFCFLFLQMQQAFPNNLLCCVIQAYNPISGFHFFMPEFQHFFGQLNFISTCGFGCTLQEHYPCGVTLCLIHQIVCLNHPNQIWAFPFPNFLPEYTEHHFKHVSVPDHRGEAGILLSSKTHV